MEINELDFEAESSKDALKVAASCLQEYQKIHGCAGRPYEVLSYMATATLERLEQGTAPKFKNSTLRNAVQGKTEKDASAWLSPIWKKLSTEYLPSIQDSIEGFARAKGYEYYPWVGKTESSGGAGNQALYFLTARKVTLENQLNEEPSQQADIHYLPAVKITPSWWARWLFDKNYSAIGWRKWLYLFAPLAWLLILWLLGSLLWIVLSREKAPLSSQGVISILLVFGIATYCRHVFRQLFTLFDDRIMLAPDHLVSSGEFGVCVELHKGDFKNKSNPRVLRLVKYLAECPICGAEVLLDKGEPDFPRRIIGRCNESPREHIFSFDRISKAGMKLRG